MINNTSTDEAHYPFNNGVTSLTRLSGQEYPGLVMLTMVSLDKMLPSKKILIL
jgi:hypothetical protein